MTESYRPLIGTMPPQWFRAAMDDGRIELVGATRGEVNTWGFRPLRINGVEYPYGSEIARSLVES